LVATRTKAVQDSSDALLVVPLVDAVAVVVAELEERQEACSEGSEAEAEIVFSPTWG
jgi:hypothetical protein